MVDKKQENLPIKTVGIHLFILFLLICFASASCYLFDWSDDAGPALSDVNDDDDDAIDEEGPSCQDSDGNIHYCTEVISYLYGCEYETFDEEQSIVLEHCQQNDPIKVCAVNCFCDDSVTDCDSMMDCADTCF